MGYAGSASPGMPRKSSATVSDPAIGRRTTRLAGPSRIGGDAAARTKLVSHLSPARTVTTNADLPTAVTDGGLLVVLDGIVARCVWTSLGRRQIVGLLMGGDICSDRVFSDRNSDWFVALTPCTVACLPFASAYALSHENPAVARAIWRITARSVDLCKEWIRTDALPAEERLAHRICEVLTRMRAVPATVEYQVPWLRQNAWAEMTAMTIVHANRCLKRLSAVGLLRSNRGALAIPDPASLAAFAEFDPAYLWPRSFCPADELGDAIGRGPKPDFQAPFA